MKTYQKVSELLDKGYTVLEVAHELRISPQAVYKHINKHNLEIRKTIVTKIP